MTTKTLENAKNYSNNSSKLFFARTEDYKDIILGGSPFGTPDIDDVFIDNIDSVENAIQDTISIATSQIGDVVIKDSNTSPSGFSQVDRWEFSSAETIIFTEDETINILGKRVLMVKGTNIENVTVETQRIIQDYIDQGIYFDTVTLVDNTTLEVTYSDRRSHNPKITLDEHEFTITKNIIQDVIYGYGQWSYMGKETVTTDIGDNVLYYFKRIG